MLNPLFTQKIILLDADLNEVFVRLGDYTPLVLSGWVESATAKRAYIYRGKAGCGGIYFLSTRCANGTILHKNTYLANKSTDGVFTLQSCETGVVKSLESGELLPYYWAKEICTPPLLCNNHSWKIEDFLTKYTSLQVATSSYSTCCLDHFLAVASEKGLSSSDSTAGHLRAKLFPAGSDTFLASFGHGDLWAKEVFCKDDGGYVVIDWEWTTVSAPVGSDLLDFMSATMNYDELVVFLTDFLQDKTLTSKVWQILSLVLPKENITYNYSVQLVRFFLFRFLMRAVIQYPTSTGNEVMFKKLLSIFP